MRYHRKYRKSVMISCLECGRKFTQKFGELNRKREKSGNIGKFCSVPCSVKFRKKNHTTPKPNCRCRLCGKEFYRGAFKRKNSKIFIDLCSKKIA